MTKSDAISRGSFIGDGSARIETRGEGVELFAVTDAELIRKAQQGSEIHFSELVERYLSPVFKFAYRFVGNPDDSSDIAQEAFVKAWKHLGDFEEEKSFKTWIFAIAKNTALDFLKKKRPVAFSRIEEDGDVEAFLAPYLPREELPLEVAAKKEDVASLRAALQSISPSYRTVLALRYEENLKFREIAEILGEPIDTIKSKHRRGIILLRKALPSAG